MCNDNEEQKDQSDHKSNKAVRIESSESQQNQTVEELEENAAEIKCPENKPDDAEHSKKNDDNKTSGGGAEDKSVKPSTTNEKVDELEGSTVKTECDRENKLDDAEHSENNDDNKTSGGEAEDKSVKPSTTNEKVDELEESTVKTECDRENKLDDAEHSENNDDNKTSGGEAEDKSVKPSTTNEKGKFSVKTLIIQ
ncbi:interferon-induced very large GTPase 1-like isoform X3 [Scomber scombrus]|uniref:Interferon-induced very large GTPase 1-like isoform X3 n=2 Tax=Scomber scombrus TaxID=13677 RepID=A0AAV1QLK1_SCOSC